MTSARKPDRISLQTRDTCPVCGSSDATTLWAGSFSDPAVKRYMDMFHYSGDWRSLLGDSQFALVRCKECGMAWHREVIAPEWLDVVYGQWADADQAVRFEAAHTSRTSDRSEAGVQLVKLVLRLLHLVGPDRPAPSLLDFGCGDGALLRSAEMFGMRPYGIDISASRTESARQSGISILPTLEEFDAVVGEPVAAGVLSQVLEHVSDPLALLRALHGRMVPGGVLFVGVPDCSGISVPRNFDEFHKVQPIEHMNAFTPASLRAICQRAGFRAVRRPSAFVTTRTSGALRSAVNWFWQPRSTDQFFFRE